MPDDSALDLAQKAAWALLAGDIGIAHIQRTNDPHLLEKFTSDPRRLGGAG